VFESSFGSAVAILEFVIATSKFVSAANKFLSATAVDSYFPLISSAEMVTSSCQSASQAAKPLLFKVIILFGIISPDWLSCQGKNT
jgi:hypothetical protein